MSSARSSSNTPAAAGRQSQQQQQHQDSQQLPPLLTHATVAGRPKTSHSNSSSGGVGGGAVAQRGQPRLHHRSVQTDASGPDDLQNLIGFVLEECRRECLDRRRVFMLKCQIVQLERQMLLMSDSIGTRREATVRLAERLGDLMALCQAAIGRDTRAPEVPVKRADLMQLLEEAGRIRQILAKQVDSALNDLHHQSFLLPNAFVKCGSVTLKEVAESARGMAFLNLARVGQLEADLADLHGQLAGLRPLLASARPPLLTGPGEAALSGALDAADTRLEAVGCQLMELSLLVPCLQQRQPLPDLGAALVAAATATTAGGGGGGGVSRHLADCRTSESRAAIEAVIKALASRLAAADAERLELRRRLDELEGERRRRGDFVEATLTGLRAGVRQFNGHARDSLAAPLGRVIAAHDRLLVAMARRPTDAAVRDAFLAVCRDDLPLAGAALAACCPTTTTTTTAATVAKDGDADGDGNGEAEQERRIREAFDSAMRDDWRRRAEAPAAASEVAAGAKATGRPKWVD